MKENQSSGSASGSNSVVRPHITRRKYLIDSNRQLRTAGLTTSLTLILLLFVNLGFFLLRSSQTSILTAAAPQLTPVLEKQDTTMSVTMVVLSVVLLVVVFVLTVVETHRTAGAVYALRQRLERIGAGDYRVALKFRRKDNLQDLEGPFNAMVASLRRRTLNDATTLEKLAERAEGLGPEGAELSRALRELATDKRGEAT